MEEKFKRQWAVYGKEGHRQRESFNNSYHFAYIRNDHKVHISVLNSDSTGTNEFSIISITSDSYDECEEILRAQLEDGVFENSNFGDVIEIVYAIKERKTGKIFHVVDPLLYEMELIETKALTWE